MQNFSASPREIAASLWRNKGLIRNLVHREVVGRYKGSMLGMVWSFVTPVFMLAVYTFVFSVVFKSRWGASSSDSKLNLRWCCLPACWCSTSLPNASTVPPA